MAAVLLVAAGLAAYAGSLDGPFIFDDASSIPDNPTIRHLWPFAQKPFVFHGETVAGRPLLNFSFALDYALGGLDVRVYHATNVAIHILAALTLFGVLRRTFALLDAPRRDTSACRPRSWPSPSPCCGCCTRCKPSR